MKEEHQLLPESKSLYFDLQADFGITKHMGGQKATRELAELCHIHHDSCVLDVGCGMWAATLTRDQPATASCDANSSRPRVCSAKNFFAARGGFRRIPHPQVSLTVGRQWEQSRQVGVESIHREVQHAS